MSGARSRAVAALAVALVLLSGLGALAHAQGKPKVAFIYVGPVGDAGWTFQHDQARAHLEQALGAETKFVESVPETAEVARVMEQFIRQGFKEVLAILGENGAGKSSLMNVLYGLDHPDAGEVAFDGVQTVRLKSPFDVSARGVGMVHQHFTLGANLSVADNVRARRRADEERPVRPRPGRRRAWCATTWPAGSGFTPHPLARVDRLTVGQPQQKVEIVKALRRGAKTLSGPRRAHRRAHAAGGRSSCFASRRYCCRTRGTHRHPHQRTSSTEVPSSSTRIAVMRAGGKKVGRSDAGRDELRQGARGV